MLEQPFTTTGKDFHKKLKSALVWGSSRFDGQAVPRDYILADGDVVELQL